MAHNLTETSTFDANVEVPDSGDPRTAASVETPFQALANRATWLYNAAQGTLQWDAHVYTDTVVSGIGVFVGVIRKLVVGTYSFSTTVPTEAPGSLPLAAVSTWHYLYGRETSGAFAVVVSTHPPTSDLMWSTTGVGTLRYLGCFRTDSSGNPLPFEAVSGAYRLRYGLAGRRPLNAGVATSATAVPCASYAPPHARYLHLGLRLSATTGTNRTASVLRNGDTAGLASAGGDTIEAPGSSIVSKDAHVPCDSSQNVEYLVSNADANLTIYVHGWRERA